MNSGGCGFGKHGAPMAIHRHKKARNKPATTPAPLHVQAETRGVQNQAKAEAARNTAAQAQAQAQATAKEERRAARKAERKEVEDRATAQWRTELQSAPVSDPASPLAAAAHRLAWAKPQQTSGMTLFLPADIVAQVALEVRPTQLKKALAALAGDIATLMSNEYAWVNQRKRQVKLAREQLEEWGAEDPRTLALCECEGLAGILSDFGWLELGHDSCLTMPVDHAFMNSAWNRRDFNYGEFLVDQSMAESYGGETSGWTDEWVDERAFASVVAVAREVAATRRKVLGDNHEQSVQSTNLLTEMLPRLQWVQDRRRLAEDEDGDEYMAGRDSWQNVPWSYLAPEMKAAAERVGKDEAQWNTDFDNRLPSDESRCVMCDKQGSTDEDFGYAEMKGCCDAICNECVEGEQAQHEMEADYRADYMDA